MKPKLLSSIMHKMHTPPLTLFKKGVILALTISLCYGVERFCHKQTDGFAVHKILSHLKPDERWDCTSWIDASELRVILSQPFTYLGKGAQCYVFASQDGHYVLKFFRMSHIEAPRWFQSLPLPSFLENWRQQKIAVKQSKMEKDFLSYIEAYHKLREETGMIFLHLNKGRGVEQKLSLIDKIGIVHQLDLSRMQFILQKRAKPFYPALQEMIEHQEIESAKRALSHLVQLFHKRHCLGLEDKDPDLKTNFGWIDAHPIQFDVGRFKKRGPNSKNEPFHDEVLRITDELRRWLQGKEPSLASYLDQQIQLL